MLHTFYITENKINGKKYAGIHSTIDLDDGYLGSGKLLLNAVEKYGKENFVIIDRKIFTERNEAVEYEATFINEDVVKSEEWYNIALGGGCPPSPLGRKATPEARKNISRSKSGSNNPMYGKPLSDEHKAQISNKLTGKKKPPRTDEHRASISERMTGLLVGDKNPARRPDVREKLRISSTGRQHTSATKQKLSKWHKANSTTRGKPKRLVSCPHCNKSGGQGAMQRWHFDNCKDGDK